MLGSWWSGCASFLHRASRREAVTTAELIERASRRWNRAHQRQLSRLWRATARTGCGQQAAAVAVAAIYEAAKACGEAGRHAQLLGFDEAAAAFYRMQQDLRTGQIPTARGLMLAAAAEPVG